MKFHTLALAAALLVGTAAFAAPDDTAKIPAGTDATQPVKAGQHVTRHAVRHHSKAQRHAAAKQRKAQRVARRHPMRNHTASVQSDGTADSRAARMDEALQKFRSSHS